MAETVESFVARLQQEGVESGQKQAGELVAAARLEAERIVDDARREAQSRLEATERRLATERARTNAELKLAARDVALKLQNALTRALRAALARGVGRQLSDPDFLAPLLRELVLTYARAEASGRSEIEINLSPEMHERLADRALAEMNEVEVKATLHAAGFEYRIAGATIEVTLESVVEQLLELVGPAVRELFGPTPVGDPS